MVVSLFSDNVVHNGSTTSTIQTTIKEYQAQFNNSIIGISIKNKFEEQAGYIGSYYGSSYIKSTSGAINKSVSEVSYNRQFELSFSLGEIKKGDNIRIYYETKGYNSNSRGIFTAETCKITETIHLSKYALKEFFPRNANDIGTKAIFTSFGTHSDGSRKGEIDRALSSSATTGSIALGNAVGYMSIVGNDGVTYKIPVYTA